jgi:beta-phosphoglucomutase
MGIDAVIFDLDGTIANTIDLHYRSWQQLAADEGLAFDDRIHEGILGRNREDSLAYLLGDKRVGAAKWQELLDRKNQYYLEYLGHADRRYLLPGIWDLLHELDRLGLTIALASSSKNATVVLDKLEIIHFFAAIADGNSVEHPKPAPDVFLHAARAIDTAPSHCLAVEDAPAGISAAIAAGMPVLGVGTIDRVKHADIAFPSLEGIRWQDILDRLPSRRG